ncbi:glutathione S-transferase family protein [Solilutibacter silvestris]|uniref:Glutathione S-transferase n=1 Tax=Solilutibacter silvestris TaxID=1645665 RepID=A0A2K1PY68_9GAMM|nr:glutathione S-transferase family protein [Lysobacter silvestris]PNS07735.1 Glutathione S-transferase [Lysobacter silvestris]
MSDALTLYTHPMSRGRVARWMLEETGLPYEAVILEYGTSMKSPDYLAINPMGKVPALKHGDTVITENAAICTYLADLVPEKKLAPPVGSKERGSYYRWLSFLTGPVESMLTAKQTGHFAPATYAGYGNDGEVLDVLESALVGKDHLAGDHFTAADLYAAALLGFYLRTGVIEPRPEFTRFAGLHAARPAFARATGIDTALLADHPLPSAA